MYFYHSSIYIYIYDYRSMFPDPSCLLQGMPILCFYELKLEHREALAMWVFSLIPFYSSICQLGFISWALKSTDCGWIGIQSWQTDAIRKLIHTCWIPSSTLLKAFLLPCPVCARAPSPAVARTAEARSKLPPKCRGAAKENPFFFFY